VTDEETLPNPASIESLTRRPARNRLLTIIVALALIAAAFYGGNFAFHKIRSANPAQISGAPFAMQTVNGLAVNLIAAQGQLRQGDNEVRIEFRDSSGGLVDVGEVKFDTDMNMPGMVMHSGANIERTSTPGQYRAKIKIDMAGDWAAKVSYEGPQGK